MTHITSKRGEAIELSGGLFVAVLEISGARVSFGVWDSELRYCTKGLSKRIADVCRNRSAYFWLPRDGNFTLVVRTERGREMLLLGSSRLRVLEVGCEWVTFCVTESIDTSRADGSARWPATSDKEPKNRDVLNLAHRLVSSHASRSSGDSTTALLNGRLSRRLNP